MPTKYRFRREVYESHRLQRDNVTGSLNGWPLEHFGDYICLDVMKRELNHQHLPYIAMSPRNELEKVCVCAEGIVAAKKDNAGEQF